MSPAWARTGTGTSDVTAMGPTPEAKGCNNVILGSHKLDVRLRVVAVVTNGHAAITGGCGWAGAAGPRRNGGNVTSTRGAEHRPVRSLWKKRECRAPAAAQAQEACCSGTGSSESEWHSHCIGRKTLPS